MKSIRQQLIDWFPPPPGVTEADDQLEHALYFMLWGLGDSDVAVDGWTFFKITGESNSSLDAVGMMDLLPEGSMPIALHVRASDGEIRWNARASLNDEGWLSMSDSKRWTKVYLFASGGLVEPPWEWNRSYKGNLQRADA